MYVHEIWHCAYFSGSIVPPKILIKYTAKSHTCSITVNWRNVNCNGISTGFILLLFIPIKLHIRQSVERPMGPSTAPQITGVREGWATTGCLGEGEEEPPKSPWEQSSSSTEDWRWMVKMAKTMEEEEVEDPCG